MLTFAGCFSHAYNYWLVGVAASVCAAASATTFNLLPRMTGSGRWQGATLWGALTTVTGAAGIWSTHFIAMMAYRPVTEIGFEPELTALSLLIALALVGAALGIAAIHPGTTGRIWGGVVLGLATSAMHYTGVSSMAVAGWKSFAPATVIASLVFSIVFSVAALLACGSGEKPRQRASGAVLFAVSIVLLHFTGMDAITIHPDPSVDLPDNLLAGSLLGLAVAAVTLLIVGSAGVAFLLDLRMRRESETKMRFFARHDALTSLPNRLLFEEVVQREIAPRAELARHSAVFCLDLDGFKSVNDIFGHGAGDEVLVEVASRLQSLLGERCMAARLGGDEFAVLATGLGRTKTVDNAAQSVIDVLSQPYVVHGSKVDIGCSIGVSQFPSDGRTYQELIEHADLALGRAKHDGRGVYRHFDVSMDEAARERRAMGQDLVVALETGQFRLEYQPQIDIGTNNFDGFEALLRWDHPVRGPVPPSTFIPIAEETGLILKLGAWVLAEACREAASWAKPLRIAVNLSVAQFRQSDLVDTLRGVLDRTGLDPRRLEIEVTESLFFDNPPRVLKTLAEIKDLGARIAMDDFGTGFSSLATLQSFPFDVIKIDRSFTGKIGEVPKSTAIVRALIGLGRSLDIAIVAEGVETVEQFAFLREQGCDFAQGYYCGKPRPADAYSRQTSAPLAAEDEGNVVPLRAA